MRMWQTRLLDTLGFLGTYSRVWRESRVVATASVKKKLEATIPFFFSECCAFIASAKGIQMIRWLVRRMKWAYILHAIAL